MNQWLTKHLVFAIRLERISFISSTSPKTWQESWESKQYPKDWSDQYIEAHGHFTRNHSDRLQRRPVWSKRREQQTEESDSNIEGIISTATRIEKYEGICLDLTTPSHQIDAVNDSATTTEGTGVEIEVLLNDLIQYYNQLH